MGSGVTPPLSPPETVQPLKKATCGACPEQGRRVALDPLAPTYWSSTPPLADLRAPRIWRFLNGLKPYDSFTTEYGHNELLLSRISKYGQAARPISTG